MNATTIRIQAKDLRTGDVIVAVTSRGTFRNTVTSDARTLGGSGRVAFGLTREGRQPWDGRLAADAPVDVERPQPGLQEVTVEPVMAYGGTGRQTPDATGYATRHAAPSAADVQAFRLALHRVASRALNAATWGVPADLVDYLAGRAEAQSEESYAVIYQALPTDTDAVAEVADRARQTFHATRTEAARTVLVALGIETGNIAPIDYPTITRYWLACRNAYGWTGQ